MTLFDPLSLSRMSMATWWTDVIVARKFSEAMWRQTALIADAMSTVAYPSRAG
jgi:hypothetical protein